MQLFHARQIKGRHRLPHRHRRLQLRYPALQQRLFDRYRYHGKQLHITYDNINILPRDHPLRRSPICSLKDLISLRDNYFLQQVMQICPFIDHQYIRCCHGRSFPQLHTKYESHVFHLNTLLVPGGFQKKYRLIQTRYYVKKPPKTGGFFHFGNYKTHC